jgi:Domain of unknown function (DUF4157)
MLHAPVSENKTQDKQSKTQSEPESERRALGWTGYPALGLGGENGSSAGNERARGWQPINLSTLSQRGVLQRKCACGSSAGSAGACSECQSKEGRMLQTKLSIGASDDKYELEADRVADEVMAMSASSVVNSAPPRIQRFTGGSAGQSNMTAPASVDRVLSSPGRPLEPSLQQDMGQRFGHDFSRVKVHTGGEAARSARDVNADAYTVGHNIVFGEGQFMPETQQGRRLVAHELTHVVQQSILDTNNASQSNGRTCLSRVIGEQPLLARSESPLPTETPLTENELLDVLVNMRAFSFSEPGTPLEDPNDVKPVGRKIGAQAGDRKAGDAVFAIIQITDREGKLVDRSVGAYFGGSDQHAEQQALTNLKTKLIGRDIEGGELLVVVDQKPCSPESKDCAGSIVKFASDHKLRHRIRIPTRTNLKNGKNVSPKTAARGMQRTDFPKVILKDFNPDEATSSLDKLADAATSEPYELSIAGQTLTVSAQPAPSITDLLNSGPENKAIAESVPGVILKKLHRQKKGADTIDAEIETSTNSKSQHKSIIPIEAVGNKVPVIYKVDRKTRSLTLSKKKVNIPIEYHKLSTGAITKLDHNEETGLSGEGYIKPSIPLLAGIDIHFTFAQDFLEVTVPKKKPPKIPIPGFKVTDFNFGLKLLPEFEPSGTIAFTIGTGKRKLIDGIVTITADAEGLLAKGDVVANIPGLDETKGTVTYRKSTGWSGLLAVTTSKIPYVQNAKVTAALSDKGLDLDGGMTIALPGEQKVGLDIKKRNETSWIYTGKGEFKVPRLKPVEISFLYDGEDITGTAKTGFAFKGLNGEIDLRYENGVVTGKARLEIIKSNGRLKGYLDVTLNKNRKFSGEGMVSYEIKPGLIASAGILLDKEEKVTVVGSLTFPPYKLFEQHPNPPSRINIFSFPRRKIPVPFLSFGPFGVQAQIGAGILMSYGIGPGMIKDGFIKAKVDPLEDDPDPEFELGGRISVPMFFSVTGYISGGLVLDALIAEVGGKIIVSATAGLAGEGGTKFSAKYSKGEFKAEVDLNLILELILQLCVDVQAWAEAGVWRFKVKTSKTWNLANYSYKPGLRIGIEGLKKPISYSSKTGFTMPSVDDINWVKPTLDVKDALKSGIDAAGGEEQEGAPKSKPSCPAIEED